MRGDKHLTKTRQYAWVYRTGKSWANRYVVMKVAPNGLELSRYGISVSRRIGTAVTRNHVKRLLREILRQTPLKTGWDIVAIARPPSAEVSYATLKKAVGEQLSQAQLVQGDDERVCLATD